MWVAVSKQVLWTKWVGDFGSSAYFFCVELDWQYPLRCCTPHHVIRQNWAGGRQLEVLRYSWGVGGQEEERLLVCTVCRHHRVISSFFPVALTFDPTASLWIPLPCVFPKLHRGMPSF